MQWARHGVRDLPDMQGVRRVTMRSRRLWTLAILALFVGAQIVMGLL